MCLARLVSSTCLTYFLSSVSLLVVHLLWVEDVMLPQGVLVRDHLCSGMGEELEVCLDMIVLPFT